MRLSLGKFSTIGLARWLLTVSVLSTSSALAATDGQDPATTPLPPFQVAQVQPPATETTPVGPDQSSVAPLGQPAAPPLAAEIPKPFHGSMSFEAGSGKILTLTLPAANIYVADPKVAEVRPASSTSLFVFGVGAGHTTIAAVDVLGRLLADYQITVRPSAFGAQEAQSTISRLIPGSRIQVKPQGKGMILTGNVANAGDAAQATMIAKSYGGEGAHIENQMSITAPTQVTLQVRMAEMKRSIVRTLGIDWSAQGLLGRATGLTGAAGALSSLLQGTFNNASCTFGSRACVDAVINALAKDGLAHILAEPNLTVMSGQPASFQAGGEYPYPVAGQNGQVSIVFKPYGVLLNFVPTVLSDGRINLHVRPEVSELDATNTLTITTGTSSTLAAPALKVRRTETTVELGSGESFAIAGMLQTTTGDNGAGIPGLGDTPVLGALFRTNSMTREQSELVIIVTPVVVRPVRNVAQLQIPGEGYKLPTDLDRILLLRQTRNADGTTTTARPPGQAGFIVR